MGKGRGERSERGEEGDGDEGRSDRRKVTGGGGCAEEAGLRPAPTSERMRRRADLLGGLVGEGYVVRHGLPKTPDRLTTNGGGTEAVLGRLGCCGLCGSIRQAQGRLFERLWGGSPRTCGGASFGLRAEEAGLRPATTLESTRARRSGRGGRTDAAGSRERQGWRRTLGDLGHGWVHAAFPNDPPLKA